jgi:hypothetical protein
VKTIQLKKPIKSMGEEVSALTLPEKDDIFAGVLKAMDRASGEVAKTFELVSALTKIPVSDLEKMSLDDYAQVAKEVQGIFGNFQ